MAKHGPQIVGRVVTKAGAPIADAVVAIELQAGGALCGVTSATGEFQSVVEPGTIKLSVEKEGFKTLKLELQHSDEPVRLEMQPVDPPEHVMQFFTYGHLPPHLQAVSKPFSELAAVIMELPRNQQRTMALNKLLESKDAAVRALLAK